MISGSCPARVKSTAEEISLTPKPDMEIGIREIILEAERAPIKKANGIS